ncbi:hypothetical protein ABPG77_002814, partial [Micractinium sp. CCAP 211/92]
MGTPLRLVLEGLLEEAPEKRMPALEALEVLAGKRLVPTRERITVDRDSWKVERQLGLPGRDAGKWRDDGVLAALTTMAGVWTCRSHPMWVLRLGSECYVPPWSGAAGSRVATMHALARRSRATNTDGYTRRSTSIW